MWATGLSSTSRALSNHVRRDDGAPDFARHGGGAGAPRHAHPAGEEGEEAAGLGRQMFARWHSSWDLEPYTHARGAMIGPSQRNYLLQLLLDWTDGRNLCISARQILHALGVDWVRLDLHLNRVCKCYNQIMQASSGQGALEECAKSGAHICTSELAHVVMPAPSTFARGMRTKGKSSQGTRYSITRSP